MLSYLFWKTNFHLISNNLNLSKQKPTATYQKKKKVFDYLLINDITNQQLHSNLSIVENTKFACEYTAKLITKTN